MSAFTHVYVYVYVHVLRRDGVFDVRNASDCDVELFHLHIYMYVSEKNIHERIFTCIHIYVYK